jgi:hypothetical protein
MSSSYSDQPSPHDRSRNEGYSRTPPTRAGEEEGEAPRLGSLAQKARTNHLKQARVLLFVIGALTIIANAIALAQFHSEIGKIQVAPDKAGVVTFVYAAGIGFILLGVVFVVFGAILHLYPVPVTIISLVLFLLGWVITVGFAISTNTTEMIASGIIVKIIIIIALVKSIQSALAYEKERQLGTY